MIDPHEYELTDEEHEALVAISEHAILPPLSPAARAVLDAFGKHPLDHDCPSNGLMYGALPAALRAAADQVVPEYETIPGGSKIWPSEPVLSIRTEFLAIAAELEAIANV